MSIDPLKSNAMPHADPDRVPEGLGGLSSEMARFLSAYAEPPDAQ